MGESISACQLLLHLTHVGNICCTWHTVWCNNAAQASSQWTLHQTDLHSAATLCQTGRNIHTNEVQQFPADVLFNVIITCQVRLRWLCDAALPGCDCVNKGDTSSRDWSWISVAWIQFIFSSWDKKTKKIPSWGTCSTNLHHDLATNFPIHSRHNQK